jgi:hypothetical protein
MILAPKRKDLIGGRRKIHDDELHNLYSSPSIIRPGMYYKWWRRGIHVGHSWES